MHLPKIEFSLTLPEYSSKWHIGEVDVQRLLRHTPKTKTEAVVQDIIRINSLIGLRIGELLTIVKDNITIDTIAAKDKQSVVKKVLYIRFAEHKKSKERTIVIVDAEIIDSITKYINESTDMYLWTFQKHNWFNVVLQDIARKSLKK